MPSIASSGVAPGQTAGNRIVTIMRKSLIELGPEAGLMVLLSEFDSPDPVRRLLRPSNLSIRLNLSKQALSDLKSDAKYGSKSGLIENLVQTFSNVVFLSTSDPSRTLFYDLALGGSLRVLELDYVDAHNITLMVKQSVENYLGSRGSSHLDLHSVEVFVSALNESFFIETSEVLMR